MELVFPRVGRDQVPTHTTSIGVGNVLRKGEALETGHREAIGCVWIMCSCLDICDISTADIVVEFFCDGSLERGLYCDGSGG